MFTGPKQRGKQENQVTCKCTQVCERENISLFKGTHYPALTESCHEEMWVPELPEGLKIGFSLFFCYCCFVKCSYF